MIVLMNRSGVVYCGHSWEIANVWLLAVKLVQVLPDLHRYQE